MPVELQNASNQAGLPDGACVSQWVDLTLLRAAQAQARHAELCVRYVDADEGAQLNAQFRNIDRATNVLSFPAELSAANTSGSTDTGSAATGFTELDERPIAAAPDDNLPMLLGDLVICGPVVAQEAQAQGKTLTDHTTHLIVHGVLHLLGYDHETDNEAQAMESLEISLLAELGIANPYLQAAVEVSS